MLSSKPGVGGEERAFLASSTARELSHDSTLRFLFGEGNICVVFASGLWVRVAGLAAAVTTATPLLDTS